MAQRTAEFARRALRRHVDCRPRERERPALAGKPLDQRAVEQGAAEGGEERRAGGDGEEVGAAQRRLAGEGEDCRLKGSVVIVSGGKSNPNEATKSSIQIASLLTRPAMTIDRRNHKSSNPAQEGGRRVVWRHAIGGALGRWGVPLRRRFHVLRSVRRWRRQILESWCYNGDDGGEA